MTQQTAMALFCLMYFFVAVQAVPVHQLKGEALQLAKQNGFLSDMYDKVHVIKLSEKLGDSLHPLNMERIRRKRETKEKIKLNMPINGFNYSLSLDHPVSVLHHAAEIIVADGSKSEEIHKISHPDCHLIGNIDEHSGSASLSYCDRLRGFMIVDDVEYIIEALEDGDHVVAERYKPESSVRNDYEFLLKPGMDYNDEFSTTPPTEELERVVIEIAVYCDAEMTELMENAKADTVQKKVDYIISKFNGVQYEYDKVNQLKKVVVFQIKKMVFFKTNPEWLQITDKLYPILTSLCAWSSSGKPYDMVYMITGHYPISPIGVAWRGGACNPRFRCGVSMGTSWGRYVAIAHEIGHLLGMRHDVHTNCKSLPSEQLGLMGGKGTDFSTCSAEAFRDFLEKPKAKCLFTKNIEDDDVMLELKDRNLEHIPSVTHVTQHQYCENLKGPGYRYREKEGMKYSCDRGYYCIQLKEGPDFGLIYQEPAQGIVGMYCAPGKVCLKRQCLTYHLMTLHQPWVVRAGGWGNWSEWTPCSRTCGTGVKYSHRECNNPTPIQHKYCDGTEYLAELCNTTPCPEDPVETEILIRSRADETCRRLVKGNFLNNKTYQMTGRLYGIQGYDNTCDIHCDNDYRMNSRDAIMPDGTPCSSPDPEFDIASKNNVQTRCFRGKCQVFGCDGKFPATSSDCKSGSEIIG